MPIHHPCSWDELVFQFKQERFEISTPKYLEMNEKIIKFLETQQHIPQTIEQNERFENFYSKVLGNEWKNNKVSWNSTTHTANDRARRAIMENTWKNKNIFCAGETFSVWEILPTSKSILSKK